MPTDIKLDAGEAHTFFFGKPFDFEGNEVALERVKAQSLQPTIEQPQNWISIRNDTIIEKVEVYFTVPEDAITQEVDIEFIFKDDHKETIARTNVIVRAYITAIEKEVESDFSIEDYLAKQEGNKGREQENLPPPIMTIDDMDDEGRIKIQFSQRIYFELPLPSLKR